MTAIDSGRRSDRLDHARRLAESGDLDGAAAIFAELAADEDAPDRGEAGEGLSVVVERMAERLLEDGEPERAADVLLEALSVSAVADPARLRVLLGMAHRSPRADVSGVPDSASADSGEGDTGTS
ncbi:hypothetical protein AB0J37_42270, partial [Microbispora rosea]